MNEKYYKVVANEELHSMLLGVSNPLLLEAKIRYVNSKAEMLPKDNFNCSEFKVIAKDN